VPGFLFSLLGFGGEVEGDKRLFREQAHESGGFADLSGSGQHDHGRVFSERCRAGFNSAWNPHMRNIDEIAYFAHKFDYRRSGHRQSSARAGKELKNGRRFGLEDGFHYFSLFLWVLLFSFS
jgi:hypothetical protein